jgi:kanamycin kinase
VVAVPEALAFLQSATAVWKNSAGGLTFSGVLARQRVFAKWAPAEAGLDLAAERDRLDWIGHRFPVPEVIDYGSDSSGEYLVTIAIEGTSAVSERWTGNPEKAVWAAGSALRAFHDSLPVESCPFDWSVSSRAITRVTRVPEAPEVDRLVVCHGDACVPNTLIGDNGGFVALVDFGSLGVADRWADIAVGAMSTEWNYGPGWTSDYLAAYGIDDDPERAAYYRDLWNRT